MIGTTYWITGLSGAGKTTIGVMLRDYMKNKGRQVVILDGDEIREVLKNEDYTREGRIKIALQYGGLSRWLNMQGVDVVACTVSMYDIVRNWNRNNIENYKEIYLELPIEELIKRDQKGIYSNALKGNENNVCGVNLDVELPKSPDLIIENYGNISSEMALNTIISELGL